MNSDVSTANKPILMRFYIETYVSIINIEFSIFIMSAPTKWIVDDYKFVFITAR